MKVLSYHFLRSGRGGWPRYRSGPPKQAHSAARNEGRSAAVSFARSVKEGKTADLGDGNGKRPAV